MSWFSRLGRAGKLWGARNSAPKSSVVCEVVRESMEDMPPLLSEISEFWFKKREGNLVPDWIHFSPHSQTKFLPHIVLWEVVDGDYLARITGETAAKWLPVKVANRRLQNVLTDEISFLPAELDRAVASKTPIYADRPKAWSFEDETVHIRVVHLPFRADHNETNRVLSVTSFTAEPKLDI